MINTANMSRAYSEVYALLEVSGDEYKRKLPEKIYSAIRDNRDISYNPEYRANQEITANNISKEALALIAALNFQYWCEDEEEKARLKQKYVENGKKEQEQYSYENLFKKEEKKEISSVEDEQQENAMIEYKKENFIKKLINKIKDLFKRDM